MQLLGGGLGGIAGDASDLELFVELGIRQNVVDHGAALVARGTEDSDKLGHVGCSSCGLIMVEC